MPPPRDLALHEKVVVLTLDGIQTGTVNTILREGGKVRWRVLCTDGTIIEVRNPHRILRDFTKDEE